MTGAAYLRESERRYRGGLTLPRQARKCKNDRLLSYALAQNLV